MEKTNNRLSQIIKEKLEGYKKTPPPHLWQRIEAGLNDTDNNPAMLYFFQKHWQVIAAVAAALLILLFVLSYAGDTGVLYQSPIAPQGNFSENTPKASVKIKEEITAITAKRAKNQQAQQISTPKLRKQNIQNEKQRNPVQKLHKTKYSAIANKNIAALDNAPEKKALRHSQSIYKLQNTTDGTEPQNQPVSPTPSTSDNWAFGIYATPERLFAPKTISNNSSAFSADVAIMYSFHNYYIQSGFSMGTSSDNSNANINFIETEFMGTYQDVYDVTFDTSGDEPKPIYHTQEVEVYDTTERNTTTAYTNSYRYMSMPLLLGHKTTLNQNLAYSLKGGPVVSFMLNETNNHNFNNQNAQVQNIYNKPAGRVTTNWQFVFSAGLHYHLHNDIWLAVEPQMKYYVNPVYNTDSEPHNHNPFALGVSTGLTVGF